MRYESRSGILGRDQPRIVFSGFLEMVDGKISIETSERLIDEAKAKESGRNRVIINGK